LGNSKEVKVRIHENEKKFVLDWTQRLPRFLLPNPNLAWTNY